MANYKQMAEAKLTIEIQNNKPIELTSIIDMFSGLGNSYNKFVVETEGFELTQQTRLYVKEVRKGSQIYELVDLVPAIIPFVENTNAVFEFTKHLKSAYDYFTGKSDIRPKLDSTDIKNMAKIVEPTIKDNGSALNFSATYQENHIHYHLDSIETNAAQNRMKLELASLKEPDHSLKEKVVFYWYVAKDNMISQTGDRGIIESIYHKDLKVIFDNPLIKEQMLKITENPFQQAYIVDVKVETIEERPVLYKITQIHESFPK